MHVNDRAHIALRIGKIDLYRHDCLHVLLSRGFSLYDEAFVVGFTMGNDTQTKWWHLASFKLISTWLYPKKFRFNQKHLQVFDLGVAYGRTMHIHNLNGLDFTAFRDHPLNRLQCLIGIDSETLQVLRQAEATLTDSV